MSKRFGAIILPLQIVKHQEFAKKIQQVGLDISNNIQYLKKFIQLNHQIYQHQAKQIIKHINSTQKKLKTQNRQQLSFSEFLNSLLDITQCIENQISKNLIYMNNKKYQGMKRVNEMINTKLRKAGQSVHQFVQMVRQYNSLGQVYIKKTQYFDNIERNPIKFYSFTKNQRKYQKVIKMEQQLQRKLQAISVLKAEIKVKMVELSVKISQFYQNIRLKVQEFRKVTQIILYKVIELIKGVNRFSKIEQASQRAQQSQLQITPLSRRKASQGNLSLAENVSTKQYIKQLKKQKNSQYQRQIDFQNHLLNFLIFYQQKLNAVQVEMEQIENQKSHRNFCDEKKKLIQRLPPRCIQDIETIIQEFKVIKSISLGIQQMIPKQVFQEIFKRQKFFYDKFMEDIQQIQQVLSRNSNEQSIFLLKQAQQNEKKYNQEENDLKKQIDNKFKTIINRIRNQYIRKGQSNHLSIRADKKIQLFAQTNFQILKLNYFETNKPLQPFLKSQCIIRYQEVVKSDKIKKIVFDIQVQPNQMKEKRIKEERRSQIKQAKTSCCGIFRKVKKNNQIEQNLLQKLKKSKQIESYSCALKDGYMLYTGKITIYSQYLRFHSSFNPNTFFGSTDIFVPKFDIYQIIKGRHIMSLLVTVVTKRGSLEFTSFFTDPTQVLLQVYMSNRNTEYENLTCQNFADGNNQSQLEELKQKMKNEFVQIAQKQNFSIKSYNVKNYQNAFEVEYIYNDLGVNSKKSIQNEPKILPQMFFRVNIKHYENSLQYVFWHSQNQTLNRKKQLQTIAKNVINQDRVQKFDNIARQGLQRQKFQNNMDDGISFNIIDQVSIIDRRQKHNLDFGNVGFNNAGTPKSQSSLKNKNSLSKQEYKFVENSQIKNITSILSPKGALGQWVHNKQLKTKNSMPQQFLEQLSSSIKNTEPNEQQRKNNIINQNGNVSIHNNLNKQFENPLNKTNSIYKRSDGSRIISPNASTVKYGEKSFMDKSFMNQNRSQQTERKTRKSSEIQQVRNEGMRNVLILIIIAFALISILNIFS